ncbi:MAG: pantoate--beta-alanine ligase [Desulfuromonadales bacterium]|nr:pantoate--beta-alanine ligase [Desulfuromonadales bacterium]
MDIITDIADMQSRSLAARESGKRIAFVPTMGFLHEGHASLLREGRKRGDILVLSIFVNPTQFGPNEDLDRYPRDFARDEAIASAAGVDWIFYPTADTVYPPGYSTYVDVEGGLATVLEGACRPGHFRGVATVVAKLFLSVQPHVAFFGQKDFQQLAVIRRMTQDLNLPVEIVGMPIVREADGLAMSSRNVYLAPDERRQALAIIGALRLAGQAAREGECSPRKLLLLAEGCLHREPDLQIEYVTIRHQATLQETATIDADAVMLIAVRIGKTRLIDNAMLLAKA